MSKYRRTITIITVIDRGSLFIISRYNHAYNLGNLKNSAVIELMVNHRGAIRPLLVHPDDKTFRIRRWVRMLFLFFSFFFPLFSSSPTLLPRMTVGVSVWIWAPAYLALNDSRNWCAHIPRGTHNPRRKLSRAPPRSPSTAVKLPIGVSLWFSYVPRYDSDDRRREGIQDSSAELSKIIHRRSENSPELAQTRPPFRADTQLKQIPFILIKKKIFYDPTNCRIRRSHRQYWRRNNFSWHKTKINKNIENIENILSLKI